MQGAVEQGLTGDAHRRPWPVGLGWAFFHLGTEGDQAEPRGGPAGPSPHPGRGAGPGAAPRTQLQWGKARLVVSTWHGVDPAKAISSQQRAHAVGFEPV